jgi:hypothetical protein
MFGRFSFVQGRENEPSPSAIPNSSSTVEAERRVWVRYPANLETTVQTPGKPDQSRFFALVRDISRAGANLLVQHPFQAGDQLSVELPAPDGQAVRNVLACVVRVDQEGDEWALGCIFSRELGEEDLGGFGAKKQKHSSADQRTWMRFPCQVKATYQVVGYEETPICRGEVLNISASGISLLVTQTIEMGSLLNLEIQQASGTFKRTILACVVRADQEGSRWALGCNFIRELSEEDLQALVSV